jgi:hypothetical protein
MEMGDIAPHPEKMIINQKVISISRDFLDAMCNVGRIIISERYVPVWIE